MTGTSSIEALRMDYERSRWVVGFAMTHSLGEGAACGAGRSDAMGNSVTAMLPYAPCTLSERLSAWGLTGTGSGELTLELDGGAAERYGADPSMTLTAAEVRGDIVTRAQSTSAFAPAIKADALRVHTE